MPFYIKEFLNNTAGKGSAVLNITATKEKYLERYNSVCKKIVHKTYFVKDDIYIIVNIPSSIEGIMYDVLLKFEKTNKSVGKSIADMNMQLFSNSPSFLYTYANAYDKQKLFIKECKRKLSTKMLSDIAKTRNPYGVLSYDFSIYAALFYIVNNGYMNIDDLKSTDHIKCNLPTVLNHIKNAEVLQKERKIQKNYNKLVEEEKIKKSKNKISKISNIENTDNEYLKETKEVKNTKKLKQIKQSKASKKIKKL